MDMKNDKILSIAYKNDFGELTKIVNDWDPIGLIRGGAPEDEYDCLVSVVISQLYRGAMVNEIELTLTKFLADHFGYSPIKPNDRLKSFCIKANVWYKNDSCKMNEFKLVKAIVDSEITRLGNFLNYHGITKKNIESFLVEPLKVEVDPDDNENGPYYMWIILQETVNPHKGYVVVYDVINDYWGVAEHIRDNFYCMVIGAETLKDALEGM